jgi:hypothetical protein
MRCRQSVRYSHQQFENLFLASLLRFRPILKGAAVDELGDEVIVSFEFAHIVDRRAFAAPP